MDIKRQVPEAESLKRTDEVEDLRIDPNVICTREELIYRIEGLMRLKPYVEKTLRPALDWIKQCPEGSSIGWRYDEKTQITFPYRIQKIDFTKASEVQ